MRHGSQLSYPEYSTGCINDSNKSRGMAFCGSPASCEHRRIARDYGPFPGMGTTEFWNETYKSRGPGQISQSSRLRSLIRCERKRNTLHTRKFLMDQNNFRKIWPCTFQDDKTFQQCYALGGTNHPLGTFFSLTSSCEDTGRYDKCLALAYDPSPRRDNKGSV